MHFALVGAAVFALWYGVIPMDSTPSPAPVPAKRLSLWQQLGLFDGIVAVFTLSMIWFIVWVAYTPGDGSWGFGGQHVPWLLLLGTTIILSEIGVLIPNFYDQKDFKKRRAHNHVKALNESLAIHQVGYVSFYAAIITARFQGYGQGRMSGMLLAPARKEHNSIPSPHFYLKVRFFGRPHRNEHNAGDSLSSLVVANSNESRGGLLSNQSGQRHGRHPNAAGRLSPVLRNHRADHAPLVQVAT